jgi:hypothetical protein
MELVVTSLVSTIIIGIVYYAYSILSIQFSGYNTQSTAVKKFYLLTTALRADFERADGVTDSMAGACVIFRSKDLRICYSFSDSSIIRESSGLRDSFPLRSRQLEIGYVDDTVKLIKTFAIKLAINREWIPLLAQKTYSAKEILSAKNHAYE